MPYFCQHMFSTIYLPNHFVRSVFKYLRNKKDFFFIFGPYQFKKTPDKCPQGCDEVKNPMGLLQGHRLKFN